MLAATQRATNFGKRLIYRILHDPAINDAHALAQKNVPAMLFPETENSPHNTRTSRPAPEPILELKIDYADADRLKDLSAETGAGSVAKSVRRGKASPAMRANNSS